MKSIIYNYTLGYDTKEELAEYCAIVYGKNIFVDNIFDELSESQHVNESVLDVADDITDFIFKTYKKYSDANSYVKSSLTTCVGKPFYTNWNFHSIDDIVSSPFAKNASKDDIAFRKDSNRNSGHPIIIVFRRDMSPATAGSNVRREVIDRLYQDVYNNIQIKFLSKVEIQINYDWFVTVVHDNYLPVRAAICSLLSHELTHVYDQYKFASKNLVSEDKKNSLYLDYMASSSRLFGTASLSQDVQSVCKDVLYLMSYPEQHARIDATASLLRNMSSHVPSPFIKDFDTLSANSSHNVSTNSLLIFTVLNNNYVKRASEWVRFRDTVQSMKTRFSPEDFRRSVSIIGYYMLKHKLLNYDSNRIPVKPACINMFLNAPALKQYLTDFTVNHMIDDSVSDIIEFLYHSIDREYRRFVLKIKKVIEKYIEQLYQGDGVYLVYDQFNPENTRFKYVVESL